LAQGRNIFMLAIGSDHGGFALKKEIIAHLDELKIPYKDFGTYTDRSCDYPKYGEAVARSVSRGECDRGILICGTGIGISISANKVRGIRAALCGDSFSAEMCRLHNDANILCLGARVTGAGLALRITDVFLNTEFEGGRHSRRVNMLNSIEP
jgi:ribose 5-phosphate isomerase B